MSSKNQATMTMASASPQPLDASRKEDDMRASLMTQVMKLQHQDGACQRLHQHVPEILPKNHEL